MDQVDVAWLEQSFLNRPLNSAERELLQHLQVTNYTHGNLIMEQGQEGGMLYLLQSGIASIEHNNGENRVRIATLHSGSLFGEMSFLNGKQANADVSARSNCVVYSIDRAQFRAMMRDHEQLVYDLFSRILDSQSDKLRDMNTKVVPILRNLMREANKLPIILKIAPLLFIAAYTASLLYLTYFKYY